MNAQYEYSRKPIKCPSCKASSITTILYGYPAFSSKLESELKAGRVVLGGCCVQTMIRYGGVQHVIPRYFGKGTERDDIQHQLGI